MIPLLFRKRSRLWTPRDLPIWNLDIDAYDTNSIALNGSNVSQWSDRSGRNNHAVQEIAINQPPYSVIDARTGGKPGIGATSRAGLIGLITPSFSAKTFYFVCTFESGATTTFNDFETLLSGTGTTGAQRIMGNGSGSNTFIASGAFASQARINGESLISTILPLPLSILRFDGTLTTQSWGLGFNQIVTGRNWNGALSAVLATAEDISESNDLKVVGYLAHRWGITNLLPANHPYKNNPPKK